MLDHGQAGGSIGGRVHLVACLGQGLDEHRAHRSSSSSTENRRARLASRRASRSWNAPRCLSGGRRTGPSAGPAGLSVALGPEAGTAPDGAGSHTRTAVPRPPAPGPTSTRPPHRVTALRTMVSPSPIRAGARVVKNGSNIRRLTSSVMPSPVSSTTSSTPPSRGRSVSPSRPPPGMASSALRTRCPRRPAAPTGCRAQGRPPRDPRRPRWGAVPAIVLPARARQCHGILDQRLHVSRIASGLHGGHGQRADAMHDVGAPPGRLLDHTEPLAERLIGGAGEQELALAQDHREDLVELAGDPTADLGEGANLLGLDPADPGPRVPSRAWM